MPSPNIGAISRESARTCRASRWAGKTRATSKAVRSNTKLSGATSSGTRMERMYIVFSLRKHPHHITTMMPIGRSIVQPDRLAHQGVGLFAGAGTIDAIPRHLAQIISKLHFYHFGICIGSIVGARFDPALHDFRIGLQPQTDEGS